MPRFAMHPNDRTDRERLSPGVASHLRVEVHRDPAQVAEVWEELEGLAAASVYQTRRWILPWLDTVGRDAGIAPLFIVLRDETATAVGLLCLGVEQRGALRLATFLGAKDSNFNLGLFRPGFRSTRRELVGLLRTAARAAGPAAPDLFMLLNQPLTWEGVDNPLAALAHQRSPSFAYATGLGADADSFLVRRLSKASRKKLRQKERRLAALGTVDHLQAKDAATSRRIIDAFFIQKLARFAEQNIDAGFKNPATRLFIEHASLGDDQVPPAIELHALAVGDRIVATFGGAPHRGRFSGMFNSFAADIEIARSSPGDLLLTKLIAAHCTAGTAHFDLGIGEARYKTMFCNEQVPLFDAFVATSLRGRAVALIEATRLRLKRAIKQNARAFALTRRLRLPPR